MLLTFILLCLACTLVITALHNQFYEPESLIFFVPMYLDNFFIKHHLTILSKPLYGCMICMSSFWGSILFSLFSLVFTKFYWLHLICAVPVIAGMLVIVEAIIFMREIAQDEHGTTHI